MQEMLLVEIQEDGMRQDNGLSVKERRKLFYLRMAVWCLLVGFDVFAGVPQNKMEKFRAGSVQTPGDVESQTIANAANWMYWMRDDGNSGYEPFIGNGSQYPRGIANVIFHDGVVWGGWLNNDRRAGNENFPPLRVSGQQYISGTVDGWIVTPGDSTNNPVAIDPNDSRVRIYRIRQDFQSLQPNMPEVRRDAAELNGVEVSKVSAEMAQAVIDKYAKDWAEWPGDLGAPFVDKNGNGLWDPGIDEPGIANADQVIWFVANDVDNSVSEMTTGSPGIGLEFQVTLWSYKQPDKILGQTLFKRYRLINKSGIKVDSMFIGQWVDPDIGAFPDDFAGVDQERSLGYGYTAFSTDEVFSKAGSHPACVGYDFLQGPIIETHNPRDRAVFNLKRISGYLNVPLTSFGLSIPGPTFVEPAPEDARGLYNWLNGFMPKSDINNPEPYVHGAGPNAGQPTKFPLNGDPFFRTGDIDGLGTNPGPGDRRFLLSSGPFTFANGDTQEVIVALVGGIVAGPGGDNLNAIEQMKVNDDFAQFMYDNLFEKRANILPPPTVKVTPFRDAISLEWGSDASSVGAIENTGADALYEFEGYNVYQLPSLDAGKDRAVRIATFDRVDGVRKIFSKKYLPEAGNVVDVLDQEGDDSGLQRNFVVRKDSLHNRPLRMGTPYYFAVTAYGYNLDPKLPQHSVESPLKVFEAIPQDAPPGTRFTAQIDSQIAVTHTAGRSDGKVRVSVVDPAALTGDRYEIFFTADPADSSKLVWNVRDITAGKAVIRDQPQAGNIANPDLAQAIADGFKVTVWSPQINFKRFEVVSNASGRLDSPAGGALSFDGFPSILPTDLQQVGAGHWAIHTADSARTLGRYESFLNRTTLGGKNWAEIVPFDFEWRFVGTQNWAWDAFNTGRFLQVPFELWNIGVATPDDPSDDFEMVPVLRDQDGDGTFNLSSPDHSGSSGNDDPFTDWVYWYNPLTDSPDEAPGQAGYLAAADSMARGIYTGGHLTLVLARTVLINWNGGLAAPYNQDLPEPGTVFRITTAKPNTEFDLFSFEAPSVIHNNRALARQEVQKVNVFPNPYYGGSSLETSRYDRFVTFTHLPRKAEIRIFNLGGSQIIKLEKNSDSQFLKWNLRNTRNLPVASGLYIVRIEMPDERVTKVLKLMIIQSQQFLEFF